MQSPSQGQRDTTDHNTVTTNHEQCNSRNTSVDRSQYSHDQSQHGSHDQPRRSHDRPITSEQSRPRTNNDHSRHICDRARKSLQIIKLSRPSALFTTERSIHDQSHQSGHNQSQYGSHDQSRYRAVATLRTDHDEARSSRAATESARLDQSQRSSHSRAHQSRPIAALNY